MRVYHVLLAFVLTMGCNESREILKRPKPPAISEPPPITRPQETDTSSVKFLKYQGPAVRPAIAPNSLVWAVIPLDRDGAVLQLAPARFKGTRDGRFVVSFLRRKYEIPGAFVIPFQKGRIRAGAVVRVALTGSIVRAKVIRVRQNRVTVAYPWLDSVKTGTYSKERVDPIPSFPQRGAWAGVRLGRDFRIGVVLAMDEKNAWLLGYGGELLHVSRGNVVPLRGLARCIKGSKVLAAPAGRIFRARVVSILPHGAGCVVKTRGNGSSLTTSVPAALVFSLPERKSKNQRVSK